MQRKRFESKRVAATHLALLCSLALTWLGCEEPEETRSSEPQSSCSGPRVSVGDHCCFPGQTWDDASESCIGAPTCPDETSYGEGCPPSSSSASERAEWLGAACDQDVARACALLAAVYLDSTGVERDIEKARTLAESACASDLGSGCNTLGTILVQGAGQTDKDHAGARDAFAKACQLDDGEGCKNLALLFARGLGVDEDPMRSRQLYRRSCDLGFEPSCLVLAKMEQMDRDDARSSLERARPACKAGDQAACARLGELLFFGHAGEQNVDRAVDLLDASCGSGHSRACRVLATGFYAGEALPRNLDRARSFAERGCALDEFEACNILGLLHLSERGPARDIERARDILKRGCEAENPRACSNLARALLMDSDALETDPSEARDALRFACDDGLAESCARLADLLEGESIDNTDAGAAAEIRQRACDLGHESSCRKDDGELD